MIRIIAGKYKNRKLITCTKNIKLERKLLRPTTEKLRAAAFNILQGFFGGNHASVMMDKKVLDLCCGVGSFGLEALSREASKVCFIDNQRQHLELVSMSLEKLGCTAHAKILFANAQNLDNADNVYDVVYIDPPYKLDIMEKICNALITGKWVDENTIILVETSIRERIYNLEKFFRLLDVRHYGNSMLSFYSRKSL